MQGWKKHKLESRLPEEISITSNMQMTPPLWQKVKKNSWWKGKGEWNVGLKLSIQKTKNMASGPITSWQIDGETGETMSDFIFLGSRIAAGGDWSHKIKTLTPWQESYGQPRQHTKKQSHYFANKGPSSQSYGFSSSQVWCESWTVKKTELWRFDAFEL